MFFSSSIYICLDLFLPLPPNRIPLATFIPLYVIPFPSPQYPKPSNLTTTPHRTLPLVYTLAAPTLPQAKTSAPEAFLLQERRSLPAFESHTLRTNRGGVLEERLATWDEIDYARSSWPHCSFIFTGGQIWMKPQNRRGGLPFLSSRELIATEEGVLMEIIIVLRDI